MRSTAGWRTSSHAEETGAGILPGSILATSEHHGFELFGLGGLLLLVGATVGVLGIWLAYRWYVRDPDAPARFVSRFPLGLGPGMYRASVNKYYVDDIYGLVFARGGVLFANALWWFDAKIIDGAVNGAGWLAGRIGGGLRRSRPVAWRTTGSASPPASSWSSSPTW